MADAREQFERWYVGELVTQGAREIERDQHGNYILMQARLAWQAWHAGWLERGNADGVNLPDGGESNGTR